MSADSADSHTSAVIRLPLLFAQRHPDYAAAAREFIRGWPDVASLKFVSASVGQKPHRAGINRIVVELESAERVVWVEVRQTGDEFTAATILNRIK